MAVAAAIVAASGAALSGRLEVRSMTGARCHSPLGLFTFLPL
jgi:hypothetical protein